MHGSILLVTIPTGQPLGQVLPFGHGGGEFFEAILSWGYGGGEVGSNKNNIFSLILWSTVEPG